MATAHDVAKYLLSKTDEDAGDTISNLKLQKLLYYSQGFHLAVNARPLFDEPLIAWQHGPVVRTVYETYAEYGGKAIPRPEDFDIDRLTVEERGLIDQVYSTYGQFSAWRLREMTHDEPPWSDAWKIGPHTPIPHRALTIYFSTLVEER